MNEESKSLQSPPTPKELNAMGIGCRYHAASLDTVIAETQEQFDALQVAGAWLDDIDGGDPRNLWLTGTVGAGKTYLATALALEFKRQHEGSAVRMITASEVARRARTAVLRGCSMDRFLAPLIACDLLVIDNFDTGFVEPGDGIELLLLLERRKAAGVSSLLVSWGSPDLFGTRAYTLDKLATEAAILSLTWPSRRSGLQNEVCA